MRPSVTATAPCSITPSPGWTGSSVANRLLSHILSNRIAGLCAPRGDSLQKALFGLLLVGQEYRSDMDPQSHFFFDQALLPSGWASDVRIGVIGGTIVSVTTRAQRTGAEISAGIAIPGLPNLHCHAFQRGMAGLAERRGPESDSFWTWREVMYRFLATLTPDDVEAIAGFAYMEMLEAGFTSVGEFHYLHHAPGGRPYADLGEMGARIAAAATETGIGLTLLPSLYMSGGFGDAPPTAGQRRFLNNPDRFLDLVARTRDIAAGLPHVRVGIAPHSLRAVPSDALRRVVDAFP